MQSGRPEYHYERQKALKSFSRFNQLTICFLAERRIVYHYVCVYWEEPLLAHCEVYLYFQSKEMQEIVTLACEKWAAGDKVSEEKKHFSLI